MCVYGFEMGGEAIELLLVKIGSEDVCRVREVEVKAVKKQTMQNYILGR